MSRLKHTRLFHPHPGKAVQVCRPVVRESRRSIDMAKHQSRRAVLSVESLEDRRVAAVDAFIWFESSGDGMLEVRGETKDDVYLGKKSGAFEIKDFSFGVENSMTIGSATGGAGAGKIKFNEFTIKKTSDSASPAFFQESSRPSDEGPEESITFVYGKLG